MDKVALYRSYGATLERILDLHQIHGDRSIAKKILHKALKRAKGINTLTALKNEDLKAYIDEINEFFPLNHNKYFDNEHP